MVNRHQSSGFTLLETVVAMTILGMFLAMLFLVQADMRAWEKRLPVSYMKHPQIMAVLARVKRDVIDAHGAEPYRTTHDGYTMSDKVLIVESVQADGGVRTVVWDFREPGVVRRRSYNVGIFEEWVARGVPRDFSERVTMDAVGIPDRPWAVRITARDQGGRVAIDQILQPRSHR